MSLMKTLAKVAIGVAVAKGAQSMMKKAGQQQGSARSDGMFRAPHSPGATDAMAGTPLEGMMDSILGGQQQRQSGSRTSGQSAQGGLGGLLEQLGQQGGSSARGGAGGLEDLLGGLSGQGGAGGLGGLLGGLAGALQAGQRSQGSFGEVLNSQFDTTPEPARQPTADQEAAAGLMISAMLQAAKSDGTFDASEQATRMLHRLGERHLGYGVQAEHYPVVAAALIETLEDALGEDFTAETRQAWADAIDLIASAMISAAKSVKKK